MTWHRTPYLFGLQSGIGQPIGVLAKYSSSLKLALGGIVDCADWGWAELLDSNQIKYA